MPSNNQHLHDRALLQLREWGEVGQPDECFEISRLAAVLGCSVTDLYDSNYDQGVLFDLNEDGLVSFTTCRTCVSANGRRVMWDRDW